MTDTMTRETERTCSCGCGDASKAEGVDASAGGCSCGCGTPETPAMTVAREVAHLTSLRQSIDRRLSELKS